MTELRLTKIEEPKLKTTTAKEPLTVIKPSYLPLFGEDAKKFYVYCHIANRAEFFGTFYVATIKRLSKDLKLSEEEVITVLNALIDDEVITVEKAPKDKGVNSYIFRLTEKKERDSLFDCDDCLLQ